MNHCIHVVCIKKLHFLPTHMYIYIRICRQLPEAAMALTRALEIDNTTDDTLQIMLHLATVYKEMGRTEIPEIFLSIVQSSYIVLFPSIYSLDKTSR